MLIEWGLPVYRLGGRYIDPLKGLAYTYASGEGVQQPVWLWFCVAINVLFSGCELGRE